MKVNLPIFFGFVPRLAIVGRAVHQSERQKAVFFKGQRRARGCQLRVTRRDTTTTTTTATTTTPACGCKRPWGDALAVGLEDAEGEEESKGR